jgi:hypothetical protein
VSDHGAAIRSSAQRAPGPRGHVAHEPRRPDHSAEPEMDGPTEPQPARPDQRRRRAAAVKMRQRIARLGSSRPQTPALDPLFRIIRANHPRPTSGWSSAPTGTRATASGQMRKSGTPSSPIRSPSPPSSPSSA